MKIVFIGFATAYKSTVGQAVASELGLPFVDTDVLAESYAGKSIAEIFSQDGENAFRQAESAVLKSIAADNVVVACGGGTPLAKGFDEFCQGAVAVWLKVDALSVAERLGNPARPLFDGMSVAEIETAICRRNDLYQKYAELSVDTSRRTSEEVAREVVALLRRT